LVVQELEYEFESVFILRQHLMMAEAGIPSCKYLEEAWTETGTKKTC